MLTTLLITLLTGLPEVTIADEHRPGDPTEIKITLTNRTEEPIAVSFKAAHSYRTWLTFHFFDERGGPVVLEPIPRPRSRFGNPRVVRVEPGKSVTEYLSPRWDYVIPPGRYQIMVSYHYQVQGRKVNRPCMSNWITKTFP